MNDLRSKILFADRYRLRKRLGEGSLWEAWLADNEMAGYEQVVKIFAPLDEPGSRVFRREFARAYHLMHPRLLRATYFDIYQNRPYLVMPYCRRGSTQKLVGKLDEGEIARAMRDVGGALAYIHQPAYRIVHRDIQPENILLSDQGDYLLSDSGISSELREAFHRYAAEKDIILSSDAGMAPSAYRAPECSSHHHEKDDELMASDIWALGATLFELATGLPPFGQQGGEGQASGQPIPDLPSSFSPGLNNILKHCMAKGPWGRPSGANLRQMAEGYLESGQWPAQYTDNISQSWKPGKWENVLQRLSLKNTGVWIAVLVVLVAIAAMLAWPKETNENNLAGPKDTLPDASNLQLLTQNQTIQDKEPQDTAVEIKSLNGLAQEVPEEPAGSEVPTESAPPADPVKVELQRPARETAKEAAPAKKSTAPVAPPATEKPPKKNTSVVQPEKPKAAVATKGQQLEPRFDDLTGKWGYKDTKGTWAIWPQFTEAAPFKDGRAKVAKKGSDGELNSYYLDPKGGLILIPKRDTVDISNN
ncbi:MAG: protein kinase [Phaeodactylibacter sp.]|nr:protein kinase [Phaeodactylibacter sp.]